MDGMLIKFHLATLFYVLVYLFIAPVISGLMTAFVINKECPNKDYLWKVCVCTIFSFCGIIFLPVYIPMFSLWFGMYFMIRNPTRVETNDSLIFHRNQTPYENGDDSNELIVNKR